VADAGGVDALIGEFGHLGYLRDLRHVVVGAVTGIVTRAGRRDIMGARDKPGTTRMPA
jgi:hypothetical protein